jgi:hypothetical protein
MKPLETILSVAGGVVTLLVAPLYFIGWAYLYSYYSFFQINIYELNPPIQYVLMYAFAPMVYGFITWAKLPGWGILLLATVGAIWLVHTYGRPAWKNTALVIVSLIGSILIGAQLYSAAIGLAAQRAHNEWTNGSYPAYIQSKEATDAVCSDYSNPLAREASCFSRKHALRYLISSDKFDYFYSRGNCAPTQTDCPTMVFRIPLTEVTVSSRIQQRSSP